MNTRDVSNEELIRIKSVDEVCSQMIAFFSHSVIHADKDLLKLPIMLHRISALKTLGDNEWLTLAVETHNKIYALLQSGRFANIKLGSEHSFEKVLYEAARCVAGMTPCNECDFATLEVILPENTIITSDRYQFDIDSLIKSCERKAANPYTNQPFNKWDLQLIRAHVEVKYPGRGNVVHLAEVAVHPARDLAFMQSRGVALNRDILNGFYNTILRNVVAHTYFQPAELSTSALFNSFPESFTGLFRQNNGFHNANLRNVVAHTDFQSAELSTSAPVYSPPESFMGLFSQNHAPREVYSPISDFPVVVLKTEWYNEHLLRLPNGNLMIAISDYTGRGEYINLIRIYDAASAKWIQSLRLPFDDKTINQIKLLPSGKVVLRTTHETNGLMIYDPEENCIATSIENSSCYIASVLVTDRCIYSSPVGKRQNEPVKINIYDNQSIQLIGSLSVPGQISELLNVNNEVLVIHAGGDYLEFPQQPIILSFFDNHGIKLREVPLKNDFHIQTCAQIAEDRLVFTDGEELFVVDMNSGDILNRCIKPKIRSSSHIIRSMIALENGHIVVGDMNKTVIEFAPDLTVVAAAKTNCQIISEGALREAYRELVQRHELRSVSHIQNNNNTMARSRF